MSDRYLDTEIAKALGWTSLHNDEKGELVGHCPDHAQVALEGVPHWGLVFCGHCEDCKWWDEWDSEPEVFDDRYENSPEPWWGTCHLVDDNGEPEAGNTYAMAWCDHNINDDCHLETRPDFGCVQFERKEKEE